MRWYLGAALLLLAALFIQSSLLAYAMYVLLGLLLLTRVLARMWIENLSATRECRRLTAEVGDRVTVSVKVCNNGAILVPWVILEDLLPRSALKQRPPRLKVRGHRLQLSTIFGKQEILVRYQLQCQMRGYYQLGPLVMESGDVFGLHRRYRVDAEPHFLLVYPKIIPLEGYDIASRRPIGDVRLVHRLYEDPTRIAGVRQYQPGDSLNRIHWGATARTGMLHSKVYEPSTLAGATVLLDFHRGGYPKRGEPYRSELAVTAAVSLANAVYTLGQQIGFVTNGRDAADRIRLEGWEGDHRTRKAVRRSANMLDHSERLQPLMVPTRRGPEQLQRIREVLARVELTDGLKLPELILETISRLPRDATVVALLADVPIATSIILGNLRRRGYAVTVVLVALDADRLEKGYGRLLAEGVRDVRHLRDEAGVPDLCREHMQQAAHYDLSVALGEE